MNEYDKAIKELHNLRFKYNDIFNELPLKNEFIEILLNECGLDSFDMFSQDEIILVKQALQQASKEHELLELYRELSKLNDDGIFYVLDYIEDKEDRDSAIDKMIDEISKLEKELKESD